jgi:hypothetical protein
VDSQSWNELITYHFVNFILFIGATTKCVQSKELNVKQRIFLIEEHRHIGQKIGDKRHKDLRKAKQYQFRRSDWFYPVLRRFILLV